MHFFFQISKFKILSLLMLRLILLHIYNARQIMQVSNGQQKNVVAKGPMLEKIILM